MSLEKRIKRYMNDIIDIAFRDYDTDSRKKFKSFYLIISPKENKTYSGLYRHEGAKIEIYNQSLGARHVAKCCLHELSHHIDFSINGKTGHQKPFYEIYKKLIYASLDLGILQKKDFYDMWSRDKNKVIKMLDYYIPHPIEYSPNFGLLIKVYNAYQLKNLLKNHGYEWNHIEEIWEIETTEISGEKEFLHNIGIFEKGEISLNEPYFEIEKQTMYIDAIIYIEAFGSTYENKEKLKDIGFFYSYKRKKWLKKAKAEECIGGEYKSPVYIPGVKFAILKKR